MQCTYIMVKPDGVQRGLVGEIIKRLCVHRHPPLPARASAPQDAARGSPA